MNKKLRLKINDMSDEQLIEVVNYIMILLSQS